MHWKGSVCGHCLKTELVAFFSHFVSSVLSLRIMEQTNHAMFDQSEALPCLSEEYSRTSAQCKSVFLV